MKKTVFFLGIFILLGFSFFIHPSNKQIVKELVVIPSPIIKATKEFIKNTQETQSIFVPYWGFDKQKINTSEYDEIFYFGIVPTIEGIDKKDSGYKKIPQFLSLAKSNSEKLLVVRMIDSRINSKVLEDQNLQKKIINESIQIAQKYDFDGIVLDFEISALAFESVTRKITDFYSLFYSSMQNAHLKKYITMYGDVFYRARPYNVKEIAKNSDKVLIMAYDFHKARQNPGPNFPLSRKNMYGYDFKTMIADFTKVVPKEKLVVVFGLFGYDWMVNEKNEGEETATSNSLAEIQKKFLTNCVFLNCIVRRDTTSSETEITYRDKDLKQHILWFEDLESIRKKKEFLKENRIYSTGYWAYSYF